MILIPGRPFPVVTEAIIAKNEFVQAVIIEKDNFMTIDEKFKSRKFLLDRGMYFCILKTATYIDSNLEYTLKDM